MRAAALSVTPGNMLFAWVLSVLHRKPFQRRAVRVGLIALNVALVVAVLGVVVANPIRSNAPQQAASVVSTSLPAAPVDRVASVSIAVTAARLAGLPETVAILNQADSERIEQAVTSTNQTVVNKPQAISSTFLSNKDIHAYTAQSGDTVSSVATKFGVSSDSIRWSNNLKSNTLSIGQNLVIPPMNGIVYTVKSGDTADSLATTYHASAEKITAYNDAEIGGLSVGERIIIPDGSITPPPAARYASSFAWGGGAIFGFNGYDYGFCTWYVANRRVQLGNPVPANLGNAFSWYYGALLAHLPTGTDPKAGAVMVDQRGDHVAVVEAVNDDGSFWVSEMNSYGQVSMTNSTPTGGWGVVDWKIKPASSAYRYIY